MVDEVAYTSPAEMAAALNGETVRNQQQEIRRLERIERMAMVVAAWGPPVPSHVIAALKAALGTRLLPYPFCTLPEKCVGTGRCQAEFCCND